ncbi:hypothetical protein B0T25DRAFT_563275 [Lasiosphaeria hispida]|uniref:Uncharacterized protein n=1 Tax=Lasiosphaeria hispida TaxID=260671 RepID=A0AAJ0ML43_9PEZI|nr:hypothetical protein B0T25DRAFT_563275 [Lasiosphaeria hispida]
MPRFDESTAFGDGARFEESAETDTLSDYRVATADPTMRCEIRSQNSQPEWIAGSTLPKPIFAISNHEMRIYDERLGTFYGSEWVPVHLDPSRKGESNSKKEHKKRWRG